MPVAFINRRSVYLGIVAVISAVIVLMPALRAAEDVTVVEPESVGMSRERLQRINAFIAEYIDSNQIAGAVTLVARKGKVVHYDAQGWRDKEKWCCHDSRHHF